MFRGVVLDVLVGTIWRCEVETYKSKPLKIEPGSTKKLRINCSFNLHSAPAMVELSHLILFRADHGKSFFKEVASISSRDTQPKINDSEGVANGVFSKLGESYLYVEWTYPGYETEGTYKCEARGYSELAKDNNETCASSEVISLHEISLKSATKQLRLRLLERIQLLNEIQKFYETVTTMQETITLLNDKILGLKNEKSIELEKTLNCKAALQYDSLVNYFFLSKLNKSISNSRYYLAKSASFVSPELAQEICDNHGGYLAEINNEKEYSGVIDFLKSINAGKLFRSILISGSAEMELMGFYYARHHKIVEYLTISTSPLSNDTVCMYFENHPKTWNINFNKCWMKSDWENKYSYICEIEKKK